MFLTLGYVQISQLFKAKGETQKNIYTMIFLQKEKIKEMRMAKDVLVDIFNAEEDKKEGAGNVVMNIFGGLKAKKEKEAAQQVETEQEEP